MIFLIELKFLCKSLWNCETLHQRFENFFNDNNILYWNKRSVGNSFSNLYITLFGTKDHVTSFFLFFFFLFFFSFFLFYHTGVRRVRVCDIDSLYFVFNGSFIYSSIIIYYYKFNFIFAFPHIGLGLIYIDYNGFVLG